MTCMSEGATNRQHPANREGRDRAICSGRREFVVLKNVGSS